MANFLTIDDYDLDQARGLASSFGSDRFGYIVTPNVDQVIRYCDHESFRSVYSHASYVLLDSRFLAGILRVVRGQKLRVCLGSDLTTAILHSVIKPDDVAVLVGSTPDQARQLRQDFGLKMLRHVNPPMNFISSSDEVEKCLAAIEAESPFRFCFLAVGSPQQEIIAKKLMERGNARGLALCVGASINFVTGAERRAPEWMRAVRCEWFFRLLQNPRRMAKRYLIRGPRIFFLLARVHVRLRRPLEDPRDFCLDSEGSNVSTAINDAALHQGSIAGQAEVLR